MMEMLRTDTHTSSNQDRLVVTAENYSQGAQTMTATPAYEGLQSESDGIEFLPSRPESPVSRSSLIFRRKMRQAEVTAEELLDNLEQVKREMAEERHQN